MIHLTHILETALLMLLAYLLGCAIGYAVRRILHAGRGTHRVTAVVATAPVAKAETAPRSRRTMTPAARLAAAGSDDPALPQRAPVPVTQIPRSARAAPRPALDPAAPEPAAMTGPRSGGADNLKQIKGIGPKIEASLNGLGIYHFDQIAGWSRTNVEWVDKHLAFRGRIVRERWVEQARELARPARISA
ncbi:MAG: hypothetical protein ACOH2L_10305 [Devosia sp.]